MLLIASMETLSGTVTSDPNKKPFLIHTWMDLIRSYHCDVNANNGKDTIFTSSFCLMIKSQTLIFLLEKTHRYWNLLVAQGGTVIGAR